MDSVGPLCHSWGNAASELAMRSVLEPCLGGETFKVWKECLDDLAARGLANPVWSVIDRHPGLRGRAISRYDAATDTVTMDPTMHWRVAEISGQDISTRELRLSHCTLERWREGAGAKPESECVVKLADLKAAAEWAE